MNRFGQIALSSAAAMSLLIGMTGCMQDHPDEISPAATMETSGNNTVTWTATGPGKVTVYDANTNKIVYGADVQSGQALQVDAGNNRITLGNQTVSENVLHRGDQYRIFFEPTQKVENKTSTVETNTVETVHGQ